MHKISILKTVLKKDVKVCKPDSTGKESVSIRIRNGKTSKGAEELVTVYATYDACCPVSAVKKLQVLNKDLPNDAPAFCSKQGKNFTCKRLNVILELLTSDHFDSGKISNHSFRAGLISYFARLGHSEIDLKTIGRWSSRAYQHYIKLGRAKRHEMTVAASNIKSQIFISDGNLTLSDAGLDYEKAKEDAKKDLAGKNFFSGIKE